MKVNTTSELFYADQISKIEEHYNAKYVFESCLKNGDGNWANFPVAIFYTDTPHPEGSNYFALWKSEHGLRITNAISAVEGITYAGLEAEDEVIYSHYRHDFRVGKNGAFVDGGRDYFRYGGDKHDDYNIVNFKVVGGCIEIVPRS